MTIGIDGNEANVSRRVGIGEYAFEILKNFEKFKVQNVKFKIYLKDKPMSHMPKPRKGWEYVLVKPRKLWTQIGLPLYLFTHFPRPDVFFTPSHYAPRFSPVPTVISIMDLSYIHFPELFAKSDLYQLKNWTAYSAMQAVRIFTISNASKDDILTVYKKKPQDVVVTHLGIKEAQSEKLKMKSLEELQKQFGITGKYILFVGTLQPRKNIARLIEAFSLLAKRHRGPDARQPQNSLQSHSSTLVEQASSFTPFSPLPAEEFRGSPSRVTPLSDFQLVVVGKKGWLYEDILAAPEKFGVADRVKFLDFVTDEDLPSLYKHAEVFVLPSLYEGFGLPVLEAMEQGCPVITSNVSSLPEAGGDAALYVDPQSAEDIAEKIEKVLSDKKLRESMIEKGYQHIKNFSWEKTARETLEILEDVAKKS